MKILGIIPARAGSKRIPNKNILPFAGKPLVQHIIETACKSTLLDTIVVSSDSEKVVQIAQQFDTIIPINRPIHLATDTSPAIEYIRHALIFLEANYKKTFDIIVILQATSPLTTPKDIDKTINKLISTGADSAVSVVKLDHMVHPIKLKVLEQDKLLPFLEEENGRMAAHELPDIYVRNCAVYVSRKRVINQGLIIGEDCRGYEMPPERSVDINDPIDFKFAEFLLKTNKALLK